ncbi:MAG: hypothetical protein ACI8RZ_005849, partial [Myxococcota bacterium]
MLLLLAALAHAEDEPTDDPPPEDDPPAEADAPARRTFILNPEGELESALEGFEAGVEDTEAMSEEVEAMLEEALALSPLPAGLVATRLRGRFFLRPTLSYGGLDGHTAARLGIAGGHRWFRLSESTLALAGETRLSADVPLAGAGGSAVSLSTLAGPWIGPVGLRIGPILRYERADYGEAMLDPALTGGGRAILSAEIGRFSPYVGGGLDAILAGTRPGSLEPIALVGLSREKGWVRLSAQGSAQQTAQGIRWEAG